MLQRSPQSTSNTEAAKLLFSRVKCITLRSSLLKCSSFLVVMETSLLQESPMLCQQACKQRAAEMASPCHPVWWLGVMPHQLPHLWHCQPYQCAVLFSRGHALPGTLSSPPDSPANSRWQPACLAAPGGLTAAHFLAGLPTATLAILQTSHIPVQFSRGCSGRLCL